MTELNVKKKRAIELINDKLYKGKSLTSEIKSIKNQTEFDNVLDKYDIWRNSVGELLIQVFSNDRISKSFKSYNQLYIEGKSFIQIVMDFENDIINNLDKLTQIKSDIENGIYKSNLKSESTTYDRIILKVKDNRIGAFILLSIVIIFGLLKIINEFSKANENFNDFKEPKISEVKKDVELPNPGLVSNSTIDTIINSRLTYLKNMTILDKGIFLRYNYNNLNIGGVNIDSIKINGRTADGEPLNFRKYDGIIETDITQQPYLEIEYKGIDYSIEITGKHYKFDYLILKNITKTLNLKPAGNY